MKLLVSGKVSSFNPQALAPCLAARRICRPLLTKLWPCPSRPRGFAFRIDALMLENGLRDVSNHKKSTLLPQMAIGGNLERQNAALDAIDLQVFHEESFESM
jgi:hypothetical protein